MYSSCPVCPAAAAVPGHVLDVHFRADSAGLCRAHPPEVPRPFLDQGGQGRSAHVRLTALVTFSVAHAIKRVGFAAALRLLARLCTPRIVVCLWLAMCLMRCIQRAA